MKTAWLKVRMGLSVLLLLAAIYALLVVIATFTGVGTPIVYALLAFVIYFISNLIVLYTSRIREYYADAGSTELTRKPYGLASALYKIIYGSARVDPEKLKKINNLRAFFATDPVTSRKDIMDLRAADLDKNGRIDEYELRVFSKRAKVSRADRLMELFSTHPTPVSTLMPLPYLTQFKTKVLDITK